MKECEAPESNNTSTLLPKRKQWSRIKLLDRVALVLVMAKTQPAALSRSNEGG